MNHSMLNHLSDATKHFIDTLSLGVVIGTVANILPSVAAALTIVWTSLRIFDWMEARWRGRKIDSD